MQTRRKFVLGAVAAGALSRRTARSCASIPGADERVQSAVIGLNGRGDAHVWALKANHANARLTHVCDVDSVIMDRFAAKADGMGEPFAKDKGLRHVLDSRDVDVITIATLDRRRSAPAGCSGNVSVILMRLANISYFTDRFTSSRSGPTVPFRTMQRRNL